MQLEGLLEKMKLEHLTVQLDAVCEQAAKKDLGYREFLTEVLATEWNGRHRKGIEFRLTLARLENRVERQIQQFVYPKVLIIDGMGYLLMSRDEAGLFFRLLSRRYEKAATIMR